MNEKVAPRMTTKRSLIKTYFTPDLYIDLLKITFISDADNNEKGVLIRELLKKNNIPFDPLGTGTNRMGLLIDGYAVKFALDADGQIDNRREMLYAKELYPYVIKVYEALPNGLICVTEFVDTFIEDDLRTYRDQMTEILKDISDDFLIGDVGITPKNYGNWGKRPDGSICILDFAYIYSVKFKLFTCTCEEEGVLRYDSNFVNLSCPLCGRKYTFGDLRKKITKIDQENEIGDIKRLGYNLTDKVGEFPINPLFEPRKREKKKKVLDEYDQFLKDYKEGKVDSLL